MNFGWFWMTLAGLVLLVFALLDLSDRSPWRARVNKTEILIVTPWAVLWIGDQAYDMVQDDRFTGIAIGVRVPGSQPGQLRPLFRPVFHYEPASRYRAVGPRL